MAYSAEMAENFHRLTPSEREELFQCVNTPASKLHFAIPQLSPKHSTGVSGIRNRTSSCDVGTALSRNSTLLLTTPEASHCPHSWIDHTYYPILNTRLDRSLERLDDGGVSIRSARLVKDGDPRDEYAHKYGSTIPTRDGMSFDGDVSSTILRHLSHTKERSASHIPFHLPSPPSPTPESKR